MIQYQTSLRTRPIQETLVYCYEYAKRLGIVEVTDITHLDNIGIPVFVSIRSNASKDSLAVCMGKGSTKAEAMVGAYMEGVEIALSEPKYNRIPVIRAKAIAVLDGQSRPDSILDFCPKLGMEIDMESELDCVEATDLNSGQTFLIPAELAYVPYPHPPKYFGSNSNGLSSGNSLTEATIHGVLEVIERDINSFQNLFPNAQILSPESLPASVSAVYDKIRKSGNDILVLYGKNEFNIPHFTSILIDKEKSSSKPLHYGYGCHFFKEVALMRAITEAAQGKLGHIHGTQEKIVRPNFSLAEKESRQKEILHYYSINAPEVNFKDILEFTSRHENLGGYLAELLDLLNSRSFPHVLRVAFTQQEEPLQVVKIVIPKMEFFHPSSKKVGVRLGRFADEMLNSVKESGSQRVEKPS